VCEHPVGFEHVAVIAGSRQELVAQDVVERRLELVHRIVEPPELGRRIVGHELGDDDARLVQHHVPERDAVRDRLARDDARQRPRQLDRRSDAGDRARDEMLGDDHRRRLHHLDVLVGVLLDRPVLHDQHAEHLPAALDRHRQERMIDFLARLRPVGERRVLGRVRLVDRHAELGAPANEALALLEHRGVDRGRVEALAREQLERAVLAAQIDRAHVGDHDAGDLAHDLVETLLPVGRFAHDVAQPAHDDTQRRLGGHHTGLIAASRMHVQLAVKSSASPSVRAGPCAVIR